MVTELNHTDNVTKLCIHLSKLAVVLPQNKYSFFKQITENLPLLGSEVFAPKYTHFPPK
jgi:hypothetical protein